MVRTAILGLGKVAQAIHIPACRAVQEIQLVAGSDPRAEHGQEMSKKFGIPRVYEDSAELLAKERPELVIVGTPPHSHKQMCLLALQYGADVVCEKPFMVSLQEADEVIAEAQSLKRSITVNTQYRYMNMYSTALDKIASNDYGRLFFLQAWQQMFHPPQDEGQSWRAELKRSTLYEFGSHPLDLICHFMGDLPESVVCFTPKVDAQYDSDVLVQMTLRFPQDRIATLAMNRVSRAPERYLEMRLDCQQASMRLSLGGVARASLEVTRSLNKNFPLARLSLVKGGEARVESGGRSRVIATETKPAFASATAKHLRKFLASTRAGVRSYEGALLARDIMQIIFAGYESAETGKVVEIKRSAFAPPLVLR